MGEPAHQRLTVVADASFLIGLDIVNLLGLLPRVFAQVHVPAAVEREVLQGHGRPGSDLTQAGVTCRAVRNEQEVTRLRRLLDRGESECIVLAQELGHVLLLMDDRKACRVAREAGIQTMGVLGFLATAKNAGLISAIRPLIRTLAEGGFWLGGDLVERVLREAGESQSDRPQT